VGKESEKQEARLEENISGKEKAARKKNGPRIVEREGG
jgi:hypothetical protein